jgi:hypothetical protein
VPLPPEGFVSDRASRENPQQVGRFPLRAARRGPSECAMCRRACL